MNLLLYSNKFAIPKYLNTVFKGIEAVIGDFHSIFCQISFRESILKKNCPKKHFYQKSFYLIIVYTSFLHSAVIYRLAGTVVVT